MKKLKGRKLKKKEEFSQAELDNIEINRRELSNKDIFKIIIALNKQIIGVLLPFIIGIFLFFCFIYFIY